jgi:hypothetical protein
MGAIDVQQGRACRSAPTTAAGGRADKTMPILRVPSGHWPWSQGNSPPVISKLAASLERNNFNSDLPGTHARLGIPTRKFDGSPFWVPSSPSGSIRAYRPSRPERPRRPFWSRSPLWDQVACSCLGRPMNMPSMGSLPYRRPPLLNYPSRRFLSRQRDLAAINNCPTGCPPLKLTSAPPPSKPQSK